MTDAEKRVAIEAWRAIPAAIRLAEDIAHRQAVLRRYYRVTRSTEEIAMLRPQQPRRCLVCGRKFKSQNGERIDYACLKTLRKYGKKAEQATEPKFYSGGLHT